MRTAIMSVLVGDDTLVGVLPGGIYSGVTITRQITPLAFDGYGELLPCALLKMETITPVLPFETGSRLFFSVMLYEKGGYSAIEAARERIYDLLHRQKVTPVFGGGCWEILHADDVLDTEDTAIGCCLILSRFTAYIRR